MELPGFGGHFSAFEPSAFLVSSSRIHQRGIPARIAEIPCCQPQGNRRREPEMRSEFQDPVAGIPTVSGGLPVSSLWIKVPSLRDGLPRDCVHRHPVSGCRDFACLFSIFIRAI